jgi:hypothetical protein
MLCVVLIFICNRCGMVTLLSPGYSAVRLPPLNLFFGRRHLGSRGYAIDILREANTELQNEVTQRHHLPSYYRTTE